MTSCKNKYFLRSKEWQILKLLHRALIGGGGEILDLLTTTGIYLISTYSFEIFPNFLTPNFDMLTRAYNTISSSINFMFLKSKCTMYNLPLFQRHLSKWECHHNISNPSTADVNCSRNFVISEQQDQDFAICLSQMMTIVCHYTVFNFDKFSLSFTAY